MDEIYNSYQHQYTGRKILWQDVPVIAKIRIKIQKKEYPCSKRWPLAALYPS